MPNRVGSTSSTSGDKAQRLISTILRCRLLADLDLFLVLVRRLIVVIVATRLEEKVPRLARRSSDTSQPTSAGNHRIEKQHHIRNEKAQRTDKMERLIDAAVVIIAVIVPALFAKRFSKLHGGSPCVKTLRIRGSEVRCSRWHGSAHLALAEPDQREMAEWRCRPAFDQFDVRRAESHARYRSHPNSVRQPSLRAAGATRCSIERRNPVSSLTRLKRMISPPGFRTRANSSSVASGFGTVVTTYCAHDHVERIIHKIEIAGRPSRQAARHE